MVDEMEMATKCINRLATVVQMKSGNKFTINEHELMSRRTGIDQHPITIEELFVEAYNQAM